MATAEVDLKVDEANRLFFAHSPAKGLVFAVIGAGFTWACWRYITDGDFVRYFFVGFSMLFVIAGLLGIFWRLELDIDLIGRKVRIRRGYWPSAKTNERPLDDAEGIRLDIEYRSAGSKNNRRKVPWWLISIKFPDDKKGIQLFSAADEVGGYEKWEYYARRLKLDAVDATDKKNVRKNHWNELDKNVAAQEAASLRSPLRDPTPPPGSGIEVTTSQGRKEIVLAARGFNAGLVFIILFGGVFAGLGSLFLFAKLGIIDIEVSGSATAMMIVPPIFMLVGFGIIWLAIKDSYSSLIIGVMDGELFTENLAFGRRSGRESVSLSAIESIEIAGDVRSRGRGGGNVSVGGVSMRGGKYRKREDEVVVRSDGTILRFGGSLDEAAKVWLEKACNYAAVEGRLP